MGSDVCWLELAHFCCSELPAGRFYRHLFHVLADGTFAIYITFKFYGHFFDTLFIMVGMGAQTESNAFHIAKMEARFQAMLTTAQVHVNSMGRLAELGVHSIQGLETLVDDRKTLRAFLIDALGLDPGTGSAAEKVAATLEQGKITGAWEQTRKRIEVENRREAERIAQNLPPQLSGEDVTVLKKKFETDFNKNRPITEAQTPSKPYLELKISHLENYWEAEKLTEVTSLAQAKRHAVKNSQTKQFGIDELSCSFKIVTKPFGIAMPKDSETLRARIRVMRNAYMFLKMKFPQKGVLSTCTLAMWDQYVDYLFGDQVWNFCTKGPDGLPSSCPHIDHVLGYEQALRERALELMASGTDIESAFDQAMGNTDLKNTAFMSYYTTEIGTQRCRALTAPAFHDIHGNGTADRPPAPHVEKRKADGGDGGLTLSKRQRRTLAKQVKAKAEAAKGAKAEGWKAKAIPALQNGGVGDGTVYPKKDKGKGKGKGKGKSSDGRSFCYAYNDGTQCRVTPCPFAHICQVCEGDHPRGDPKCPGVRGG